MVVNRNKVDQWKQDIAQSVDFYNNWFMQFAPTTFRETRIKTSKKVQNALQWTNNLTNISPEILKIHPEVLPILRMATCPPIARDRMMGLAGLSKNLVTSMEKHEKIPLKIDKADLQSQLQKIGEIIEKMSDPDIIVWKNRDDIGTEEEVNRASIIIADRLCGAEANPIIRNAQEERQLKAVKAWLESHGYRELDTGESKDWRSIPNGTFAFRHNVPVKHNKGEQVNIPVDIIIMRHNAKSGDYPVLFEAKSAGDFTNTNKRRKEEAIKIQQLKRTYGSRITLNLFLCGYFDSGYLGYEAAEGIDWVWEHRINDFAKFGI